MKRFKEIISTFCLKLIFTVSCVIFTAPASCFGQADWESWQPPEQIMDSIGVKPGMRIGEAGAGQGYFTFPLARRVGPKGIVFANDAGLSKGLFKDMIKPQVYVKDHDAKGLGWEVVLDLHGGGYALEHSGSDGRKCKQEICFTKSIQISMFYLLY